MPESVSDPVCPTCYRTMEQGCLPSTCPRWTTVAVYDHQVHEWLHTDDDGYVLDGRPVDEVV